MPLLATGSFSNTSIAPQLQLLQRSLAPPTTDVMSLYTPRLSTRKWRKERKACIQCSESYDQHMVYQLNEWLPVLASAVVSCQTIFHRAQKMWSGNETMSAVSVLVAVSLQRVNLLDFSKFHTKSWNAESFYSCNHKGDFTVLLSTYIRTITIVTAHKYTAIGCQSHVLPFY